MRTEDPVDLHWAVTAQYLDVIYILLSIFFLFHFFRLGDIGQCRFSYSPSYIQ